MKLVIAITNRLYSKTNNGEERKKGVSCMADMTCDPIKTITA